MQPLKRLFRSSVFRLKRRLSRRYVPLWLKGVIVMTLFFLLPFLALSYYSIAESTERERESLFQNFYLRAHAFSLEVRTFLKDKVDLQPGNHHLVARGTFTSAYDVPVPEAVRLNVQAWLATDAAGPSLVEFYLDGEKGSPRILYLERQRRRLFLIFEAAFLSQLLDVSPNIGTDDRIFLYNAHEQPFLSNTIEEEYRVPAEWQSGIHKLFWENQINGVQDLTIRDMRFIVARYKLRDLPLLVYLARPYAIAMQQVEKTAIELAIIFLVVGVIVFLLMMYFFRDQLRTLQKLRLFIDGRLAAIKARRAFRIRDERTEIFSDIIAIRHKELRARLERDDAELRTQAKADFLASMSHEIRNPLNAILGIADLLRDRSEDADSRRYLQLIRDSGDSLLQIINDILDISKIEKNRMTLEAAEFDLGKLLSDLQLFYAEKAERQRTQIVIDVPEKAGARVMGDATRTRQIIVNLLSNALKFTENGRVTLRLRRTSGSDMVRLYVHDTGIGISREHIRRIFAAYEQAEKSTTRLYGGTGLGLSIALRLSALMQGALKCRSQPGRGTTFLCTLLLPEAVASAALHVTENTPRIPEHLARLRILVAEDNEINQMLMIENLQTIVARVDIAENGTQAIEKSANDSYDLIFMDIQMPEVDGLEAARQIRIREANAGAPRIPIVALSGNAMADDIEAAKLAGCDSHLAKPVRRDQLIASLVQFCPAEIRPAR